MQAMLHSSIPVFLWIICTSLYYRLCPGLSLHMVVSVMNSGVQAPGQTLTTSFYIMVSVPAHVACAHAQCRQNEWSGRSLANLLVPVPAAAFPTKSSHCSGESGQASFCVSDSIVSYSFILFRYFQIWPIDHHFCADTGNESHGQRK